MPRPGQKSSRVVVGQTRKIKLSDKNRALKSAMKLGLYEQQRAADLALQSWWWARHEGTAGYRRHHRVVFLPVESFSSSNGVRARLSTAKSLQ